jgi:Flp pilus assembly protein TadD
MSLGASLESLVAMNMGPVHEEALRLDEAGNYLQAYHLYMRVAESASPSLAARALNNAAAILEERGFRSEALILLVGAEKLDRENREIRENLALLSSANPEPGIPRGGESR